ncbi:hypothetical protein GCM10010218_23810 [Streptomyces mashuensis]|uniref:Beta-ketoacyl-[acyl-carrier-protein] synthase III C-terminal domain-containing protein n=1 Tax=Streptomyces mashuensis TaxID=33904 RepID=A0A919B200_9ACTN|nr:3-oxoacyl-[acyl-carrier-protein] synthase III C-terminal domain-containing protein [Streptomyces mashuensis]GHF41973.1 hypothetical protein GCM10010218_23810 [Streptomyces mashuensis]
MDIEPIHPGTPPVGISAAALWLPGGVSKVSEAVEHRRIRARTARELGHEALPCADDVAAPDMAVHAARQALAAAGEPAAALDVVCHAWMYHQGHDLWSAPHYVARALGAAAALPFGMQQVCNGGAMGLDTVAAQLLHRGARPGPGKGQGQGLGLVTTGDRFVEPGFDRWAADYGVAYGDAGTAVLLRTPAGPRDPLLLRAVATAAAPGLEEMHRGADPLSDAARTLRDRVDMRATKRAYLKEHGDEPFRTANERCVREVVAGALHEAGLAADDPRIRCVVLPRFGLKTLEEGWRPVLADCVAAPAVDLGRDTGHLGAGDATASIAELVRDRVLAPGEYALVLSAGAGFTWSCLAVEATRAAGLTKETQR